MRAPGALVAFAFIALAGSAIADPHDALITKHASTNGVPESLVRRVILMESNGNPYVFNKGNYGLMQIRLETARALGYAGSAEGLLDADTNMTYGVKYLAGAYRAAGCSEERAIEYYQRGFYKKPQSNCAAPRSPNVQVAGKEAPAPAVQTAVQRPGVVAERDAVPPPPHDVLRPRVVQVETIVRPKTSSAPLQLASAPVPTVATVPEARAAAATLPQSPPPAVAAPWPGVTPPPQTTAKAPAAEEVWPPPVPPEPSLISMQPMPKPRPAEAPSSMAMAKLDSDAAVPLPKPRPKPVFAGTPAREAKPARQASQRDVRGTPQKDEPSPLVALFQKLTPSGIEMPKLDSTATVPPPQSKPELADTPKREAKPARRSSDRDVRDAPQQDEPSPLVALYQKLTAPLQPSPPSQPSRDRR